MRQNVPMRPPEPASEHESDPATGLPIGPRVDDTPARYPERVSISGRYARLEPLAPDHAQHLFEAMTAAARDGRSAGPEGRVRYLLDRVPESVEDVRRWLATCEDEAQPGGGRVGYAIVDRATERAEGRFFLMRINPTSRVIEVGNVYFGPALARTRAATEALYLLARYALEELGYRRFEWKCDALYAPSRRAAERFGFTYEGTFRRDVIVKGRSRDTAWYSIVDSDWPAVRAAFERWLAPDNFDAQGHQLARLEALR